MSVRKSFAFVILVFMVRSSLAQPTLLQQNSPPAAGPWQPPAGVAPDAGVSQDMAAQSQRSIGGQPLTTTQFTSGSGELPRQQGQVWREYDIRPYTSRVSSTSKPEQAIVDWILRETGTEVWFSEPVALLSANQNSLRVYQTPQMQNVVKETVDRFVASQAESHVIGLRLVTVGSPNWRSKAFALIRPVNVQTPGIEAWLVSKENAAILLGDLRKRTDFREHNSPNLSIHNGQSYTITRRRPRSFARTVRPRDESWSGYDLEMGQIEEGFSLQLSPLFSLDGSIVDAVIKCHVDQIEKLVPIPIDVPIAAGPRQRVQIQIPQLVSWRLHERFRWPADQVLLLSCGVVATPDAERANPLGISIPLMSDNPGRADALLFIENKGKAEHMLIDTSRSAKADGVNYQGRY